MALSFPPRVAVLTAEIAHKIVQDSSQVSAKFSINNGFTSFLRGVQGDGVALALQLQLS